MFQRTTSWAQAESPESRSGSPFRRGADERSIGGIQRTQSASIAFQSMLQAENPVPAILSSTESIPTPKRQGSFANTTTRPRPSPSRTSSLAGSSPQQSQKSTTTRESGLPLRRSPSRSNSKIDIAYDIANNMSDDDEEDSLEDSAILHSVNQLRSAGENRRFTDEMHYLLEGFDVTQSLGIQRTRSVSTHFLFFSFGCSDNVFLP